MKCDECGQELPEGARFCTACGRRVEAAIECPQCHTQAPPGAKFCFKCGTALDAAPRPVRSEPVKAPASRDAPSPPHAAARARPPAAAGRVEPRLDRDNVLGGDAGNASRDGRGERREPTVRPSRSDADDGGTR